MGRSTRSQSGLSLIETLVAIALIGIVLGALATGIITSMRSSTAVNTAQRADVVLSSFSESVKQLPYEACLDTAYYQGQYDKYEQALADAGKPVLSGPNTQVEVVKVTHGGLDSCTAADGDPGVQQWTLKVTVKGGARTAVVVKRNPSKVPPSGTASMQVTPWSQVGDAQVGFGVTAVGSTAPVAIALYVYDCDVDSSDDDPVYVATDSNPRAACIYDAPAVGGSNQTKHISLTVIDTDGVTTTTTACAPIGGAEPAGHRGEPVHGPAVAPARGPARGGDAAGDHHDRSGSRAAGHDHDNSSGTASDQRVPGDVQVERLL